MAAVLWSPNQLCYCVCYLELIFVHNVSDTISYDQKELLEVIFFFNEGFTPDTRQGPHPRHSQEKEKDTLRKKVDVPCKDLRRVGHLPLPSVLLANLQSFDNKMDEPQARISYQRNIKTVISYFSQSRG